MGVMRVGGRAREWGNEGSEGRGLCGGGRMTGMHACTEGIE